MFSELAVDDELVAVEFTLMHARRAFPLKSAFDERWREHAPGLILQLAAIDRAVELGLDAYEFLGDDAAYKRRYANAERRHRTVRLFRRTPAGWVARWWWVSARPMLKRSRGAAQQSKVLRRVMPRVPAAR